MKPVLFLATSCLLLTACSDSTKTVNTSTTDTAGTSATGGTNHSLELVFSDSTYQITGIAKEEGGTMLVNYPRWNGPYSVAIAQTNGLTGKTPYPDSVMNTWSPGQSSTNKWVCVQMCHYDDAGTLWVLDPSAPQLKNIQGGGAKLVKMDKATGKPARIYPLGSVLSDTSYANDVRVDVARNFAYISESKGGGIVVLDLGTGKMRRVLAAHPSTISDPAYKFVMDGKELMKEGKPAKFNSDGIALTPDGAYVYYKPLTDDKLYRVPTDILRDFSVDEKAIEAKVEDLGHFCSTDGMIFDKTGNLYFGDIQKSSIVRIGKDLKMETLVQDNRLLWPDSYAIADGYLYITCSQIHKQPEYNEGVNKRTTPYTVYRMKI